MKLSAIAAASLVIFSSLAAAAPEPSEATEVPIANFSKRACARSKCACNKVQGQFCGTSTINPDCVKGHVYECGTAGNTCDYGIRDTCVECNKLSCSG